MSRTRTEIKLGKTRVPIKFVSYMPSMPVLSPVLPVNEPGPSGFKPATFAAPLSPPIVPTPVLSKPPILVPESIRRPDLPARLKKEVLKLKNFMRLPFARRFAFCEFWYSDIERQLFLGDSDFRMLMKRFFPQIQSRMLRKAEWRTMRHLFGRPRRFSAKFLAEENEALSKQKALITRLYNGSINALPAFHGLPTHLPRPLRVGTRVYVRRRMPKDGLYSGRVDAVHRDGYRVKLDPSDKDVRPTSIYVFLAHFDAASKCRSELLPLYDFLKFGPPIQNCTKIILRKPVSRNNNNNNTTTRNKNAKSALNLKPQLNKFNCVLGPNGVYEERVGPYPLRMLVIMVKLDKLVGDMNHLVTSLSIMNDYAEKSYMLALKKYPTEYLDKYLDVMKKSIHCGQVIKRYYDALEEYQPELVSMISKKRPSDEPLQVHTSAILCARNLVKKMGCQVEGSLILKVIEELIGLLLQMRQLGTVSGFIGPVEVDFIKSSLLGAKKLLTPAGQRFFEDIIEVHFQEMLTMMQKPKVVRV